MVVKSRYNARSCPRTCFTKSLQPTGKEKGVTRRGYCCKWCKGFWKSKMGSSRFLQITSGNVVLQMVLDEPPKRLYNRWVKDRIEFYKRLEPTARTFLVLLGKLAGKHEYVCNVHLSKMSPFGSSELVIIAIKRKPTHHSLHWDGCGSTGSPPKEIPADLKVKVETLHNSVQVLFVSKQIPWIIQAQMAEDGYVTMEDLACRWVSAEKAREEGPKDLKFRDGENGFDKAISDFSAMRLYQAVLQARSLIHSGKTPSLSEGVARPTTGPSLIELHWRRIGPSRLASQSHVWSTREATVSSRNNSAIVPKERSVSLLPSISSQPFLKKGRGQPRAIVSSQWMASRRRRKKKKSGQIPNKTPIGAYAHGLQE